MHVIQARNVNDAYYQGLLYLRTHGKPSKSRAGDVLVADCPVTTVYACPNERVLFDAVRDANPFFHLFEALWMLAGRNDAKWLDRFVKDFSSRFSEADGSQHGAYGHRWRYAFGFDQLEHIAETLRQDPTSRQCVLQMWDCTLSVAYDQIPGQDDLRGNWKDRPCNTHAYFRVRVEEGEPEPHGGMPLVRAVLDMTVCCRSNDIIWGAYGANAVHFSVLLEYMAARIGVGIGRMYQVSNNFHAYVGELERCKVAGVSDKMFHPYNTLDKGADKTATFIVTNPARFYDDLRDFMVWVDTGVGPLSHHNLWFQQTAKPFYLAASAWREKKRDLAEYILLDSVTMSPDWRDAGLAWMRRRIERAKEKV